MFCLQQESSVQRVTNSWNSKPRERPDSSKQLSNPLKLHATTTAIVLRKRDWQYRLQERPVFSLSVPANDPLGDIGNLNVNKKESQESKNMFAQNCWIPILNMQLSRSPNAWRSSCLQQQHFTIWHWLCMMQRTSTHACPSCSTTTTCTGNWAKGYVCMHSSTCYIHVHSVQHTGNCMGH